MEKKTHYKTKQRELILEYFINNKDKHITAEDIIDFFINSDISVSKSTVYRYLDILLKEGVIRKYMIDEKTSACFEYIDNECNNNKHYHLRCEDCDKLFHVKADEIDALSNKMKQEFGFSVNPSKVILYGKCDKCQKENK